MAANKRKQDEKHLKMLRELVSLSHNKQCFDCNQRGPTYVNMTIGSFVCTSCSGILRGLNPPHRVKSISMMSFTPEEMECLQCRGNDLCRKVWLGLHDSRSQPLPNSKDEFKIKDFMSLKYEKKRWYVAPTDTMFEDAKRQNVIPLKKPEPSRPLRTLGGHIPNLITQTAEQTPAPIKQPVKEVAPPIVQPVAPKPASWDLLGELGGDPFSSKPATGATNGNADTGFADFSAFSSQPAQSSFPTQPAQSAFSNQPTQSSFPNQPAQSAFANQPGAATFPANNSPGLLKSTSQDSASVLSGGASSTDRYAALADLDSVFGSGAGPSVSWGDTAAGGGGSASDNWPTNGGTGPQGSTSVVSVSTGAPPVYGGSVGNPFGGPATGGGGYPPPVAPASNPFASPAQQPSTFYGQQPAPAFAPQYPANTPAGYPAPATAGYGQGYGQPQANWAAQMGAFPGMAAPADPMAYNVPFNRVGQPVIPSQQPAQQFGTGQAWPDMGNPFMNVASQQPVPPRGSSTNPFL